MSAVPSYRFSHFLISSKRRVLVRDGREVPLIPRYFDLLVLLIERRHEAVHRRDIFDRVWTDVMVSDSALNQAVRTIRRVLGDDPREPRFIRTVSRHGYQFVFPEVIEHEDDPAQPSREPAAAPRETPAGAPGERDEDAFEPLLARVTAPARTAAEEEDKREAAEMLHALGTREALARLGTRPGHASARALLRDSRWDVAGAGDVPIVGAPAALTVARKLTAIRLRRAARMVASRWAAGSVGGGAAGAAAGAIGGLLLAVLPESHAPLAVAPVLALIGGAAGALAGAGVGAGLSLAETAARSRRTSALVAGGSLGGGLVGVAVQWLGRWSLAGVVGLDIDTGGGIEGLVIGAAAGLAYAVTTRQSNGGLAAPRGRRRLQTALVTGAFCGLAALAVASQGRPLVGGTVHEIARAAEGSQVSLAPLGRVLGEPDFGPFSQGVIGFWEGALFGLGLAFGLTHRPRD